MKNIRNRFKPTNFMLGLLSWFALHTFSWYIIWRLQPAIVNNTSSADQKHFIDFSLNLLPWLFFLIVVIFLIINKRWVVLAGWVAAALSNIVALVFLLPGFANRVAVPPMGQEAYLLFNVPVSALLIPNVIDLLYLWLL